MKDDGHPPTKGENIFIYAALILCCLIYTSACLYLGYKIGALLAC